jgi:type I restriction enzyme S subunit
MTPEQLKASILQYAIQGKLVEQRPEEGTGEELYQQMQTDKQTLIREKKIKKEKPLPDIIDDEVPFDVPESWKWVKVGNVGSWSSGATPSRTNPAYYGGSIPWLKTGDLNDGFIQEVSEYITDLALEKTSLRLNPIGSVLMAMYGATIGKLGILEISVTTNQACCACIPYAGMNNKYLFYYLMSMRQSYIGMAEGGAQPNISKEKIVNSLIPLPPAEEQRRIVAKIEELLPYVDRYAAAYEKLEQFNAKFPENMKKSVLQYAIQGKLVEQRAEEGTGEELYRQIQTEKKRLIKEGKIKKEKPLPEIAEDEIPFDIPGSWKWVRVAQIVTLNPKNDLADDLETSFIPMPCVMDGFRNQHTFEIKLWKDIKKGFTHFAEGDVGVAKITPCFQNRKSVIFRNLKNGYGAGTTELTVVRTINDTVLPEYLLWLFKTEYFIANGVKSFTGTAGQQRIHKDYLATCLIPLPPLAEQKRIVAKLDEILPLCERLK